VKIAMLVHAYYLKDARVRRYAELLARAGHQVDVLCLREAGEPWEQEQDGVRIHRVAASRLRGGKLSYLWEYGSAAIRMASRMLGWAFRGVRFDVVHVHNFPDFLVFAAQPHRWLGAKVVLDLHDPMPELFQSKFESESGSLMARILRLEERISLAFADAAIAANDAFRDLVAARSRPPAEFVVVMNAPSAQFGGEDGPARALPGEFNLLYIGTLAKRYGIETVLEAVAWLDRQGAIPGLHLSLIPKIADEGSYRGVLEARIRELGIEALVSFLEPVPHHEMPAIIRGADASVYTPEPDVHMDIALSLKIPEVVVLGRPLVVSRLSVLERYFGDDSLHFVAPGDPEACARAILDIHRRPEAARAKTKRARERLEAFRWDLQAARYLALLERLAGGPVPAPGRDPLEASEEGR